MSDTDNVSIGIDGGRRFYKKHKKHLRGRKNMQQFLGGFLQEAMEDGKVVTDTIVPAAPPVSTSMAGGMKRAAMKRAAMKRAAMKKKTGGNGDGEGPVQDPGDDGAGVSSSQEGGEKRGLKKRTPKNRTPKNRKTGGGEGEPQVDPSHIQSVRSFLNQLSSGGGKKKVAAPARRRVASPARRRAASPVRRRRRSVSPVRRRSFF
jgi:hypothetical protein